MSDVEEYYIQLVARAYEGEIFGEALFGGLAEGRRDRDEQRKLACLRDLEIHTRARVLPLIQRYSVCVAEVRAQARARKAIAASMETGWSQFLAQFEAATTSRAVLGRSRKLVMLVPPVLEHSSSRNYLSRPRRFVRG